MYSTTYAEWTSQASNLIGEYFDAAKPMLDKEYEGLPRLVRFVCAQLFIDCHLSSESVLLLVREEREWDADLITRAVLEGSLKFTYLLQGNHEEIEKKADEYWNVLPRFHLIRHSENVKKTLAHVQDFTEHKWRALADLRLDDSEVAEINARYSRNARRVLEEKWSFVGLCNEFAASENPGLKGLSGLSHGYAMSSHLLHKDADGTGMVWERFTRSPEERLAVQNGHSARIVSDVCAFARLRLLTLLKSCGQSKEVLREIDARYVPLTDALAAAFSAFNETEYGSNT